MLTSLAIRFSVERTPCCISDPWVTRTVASMPFLNSWVGAARTIRPKVMATINSTRLKPRELGCVDRMSLLLAVRRNQGLHLVRPHPALGHRITHRDGNLAYVRIAGHVSNLNLPLELAQVHQDVRGAGVHDDSTLSWQPDRLRGNIVGRAVQAVRTGVGHRDKSR